MNRTADIFAGARWITASRAGGPLPIFRRIVHVEGAAARATIAICGLGQFELTINGARVGDEILQPGWTDYRKSCLYIVRDIAPYLRPGENVIAVMLGNGMYNVTGGRYVKFKGSFGPTKLIAAVDIDQRRIVSDHTWQWAPGPITFSRIYGGEDHDARREAPGEAAWEAAAETDGPGGELVEQEAPPIRVQRVFEPVAVSEPRAGLRVYDLGQNMSGRPSIIMSGAAGATVKLIPGELVDEQGVVSQKNIGAGQSFSYTARGEGEETWQPRFSYTGFRYVQAEGDLQALARLQGQFIHADLRVVGTFSCSNELLNRIHDLILAAIRSNMQSVLTDCPHREKLGWLEQAHLMGPSIVANFDASKFFAKICRDMREAQHDNGMVPTIAPQYTSFKPPWDVFNDSPEWGSAIVLVPWIAYQRYGDRKILEDNYAAMQRYVAYLRSRESEGIVDYGLGDWYDIGPGDPGFSKLTPKALTATAIYFRDIEVMLSTALLLDKQSDANFFRDEASRVRGAFRARKFPPTSQTACAMPLALGLCERDALEALVAGIRAHDNHITAGDIGFHYVIRALAENNRSDVIFDLLSRTDPPSYGAQLQRGATTLTEAWDANPKNSQNHLMLGHAEAWFHEWLGGVQIEMTQPQGRQIRIQPTPVGDVTGAHVRHDVTAGQIDCRWERAGRSFVLHLAVPDTAMVTLPDGSVHQVAAGQTRLQCNLPG